MDHRSASLKFLTSTGIIPVKVRPGQKDPFPEWDPRTVSGQDHSLVIADLAHRTELNLGGLWAGKYVDIDVDDVAKEGPQKGVRNPYLSEALDYFLPRTPYVYGRKSKPKSHRIYALQEDFERGPYGPVLRYLKKMEAGFIDEYSYSIEVRGGKPENGLFSVLPGSKHPSGELVEWDHEIDPTVGGAHVELPRLMRCIRLAVVASMIAPHWGPGVRNDMSLALAGLLWRIRASTLAAFGMDAEDEPPDGYYVLDKDDAEAIFNAVMALAGDKHGDERQRMLNLKNSWRKLEGEAGAKVTGGKALAELIGPETGPKVVKALYRLLSDNDAAETVEKLAEQFVMWYGQGVIIDLTMVQNNRANPWMTKEQTFNSLAGKTIKVGDKKIPIAAMLFGSSIVQRVSGLTFDPSSTDLVVQTIEGAMVNQWRGFHIKPCEQQVSKAEVERFYDYVVNIIAAGNEDHAHWVFAWMADLLKFPHKKPGTALVLVGVEGAGKTFLGERVIGKIVGPNHYGQTNSVTTLTHNFNTIIDNKVFIQCDEAIHSYQRDVASRLKSIITDENMIIEPKGVNAYKKPNHMRFLFTSNEENAAIFISPSLHERRFTVLRVASDRAKDEAYWKEMHLWTPDALPKIMRWLMDYKYDRWLVMRPIETEAKKNIQKVGVETELSWIMTRMAEGFPIGERTHSYWFEGFSSDDISEENKSRNIRRRDQWPDTIVLSTLEDDFRQYTRSLGKPVYSGSLLTTIKRVFPDKSIEPKGQTSVKYMDNKTGQTTQARIRLHTFPSAEQITTHLRKKYGPVIDDVEAFKDISVGTPSKKDREEF